MTTVIETQALTHRFGELVAVDNLNLSVPEGSIYAFLGPSGAGKTTTIKLLLNLLQPASGRARVLGRDSVSLRPAELAQIGYVSENQRLPEWMTVGQLTAFCEPMYPTWDSDLCKKLLREFDLPPDLVVGTLSRGMKVKAALLVALAYRPRLLILDEPFTGLDPLVRDQLIAGILALTDQENWSVFVSSHDMAEVERLADWVGFLDRGRLRVSASTVDLHARFKRLDCTLPNGCVLVPDVPASWLAPEINSRRLSVVESDYSLGKSEERVGSLFPGATEVRVSELSLREAFVALAEPKKTNQSQTPQ